MVKKTWKIMNKIQRMRKYSLAIVRNLRILVRTIYYFFSWGVPAMWKDKVLYISAAWFTAKITATVNFKREERKK